MLPPEVLFKVKGPFSKNNPSVELAPGPPFNQINNG